MTRAVGDPGADVMHSFRMLHPEQSGTVRFDQLDVRRTFDRVAQHDLVGLPAREREDARLHWTERDSERGAESTARLGDVAHEYPYVICGHVAHSTVLLLAAEFIGSGSQTSD